MKQIKPNLLLLLTLVTFSVLVLKAEDGNKFNEKIKAVESAERNNDWATAAILCEEITKMTIDSSADAKDQRYNIMCDAYWKLGHYYLHGHYYQFDIHKAIYNFEKSSEYRGMHYHSGKYGKAELYLTMIYNDKKYGVQNFQKSLEWLKKGAAKCPIMSYMLGEVYEYGYTYFLKDYISIDERTGHKMNSVNTKQECEPKLEFPNVQQNLKLAYQYYYDYFDRNSCYIKNASEEVCRYKVAVALMEGDLLAQNFNDAFEYFRTYLNRTDLGYIAENNDILADIYWRLSVMYRFGYGTIENDLKAEDYLTKAAELGHQKAITALKHN